MIFIDIKIAIILLLSYTMILGYYIWKEKIGQEFFIAFLFGLVVTSYFSYQYTTFNLIIGRINLFPLICWSAGLIFMREIYEKIKVKHRFIIVSLVYIGVLFLLEYIGYNLLGIQLNNQYRGLLGLELMHAPLGMKIFYLSAGPVYLALTDYLKVK